MTIQACAELVARGDPLRFRATMAAPLAAREALLPLYAFNLEVEQIRAMLRVIERVSRRLINRDRDGFRRGIWFVTGVYCKRLDFHISLSSIDDAELAQRGLDADYPIPFRRQTLSFDTTSLRD